MNITNVNRLPAITWRHLKLNDTTIENLPESTPELAPIAPVLPNGVTHTTGKSLAALETGMGTSAEDYVNAYTNQTQYLSVDSKVSEPVFFSHQLGETLFSVISDTEITAQENTESVFVFDYASCSNQGSAFHAGTTKVLAKSGSFIKLIFTQTLNDDSLFWDNLGIEIEDNAKVEVVQILLGGKRTLSGIKTKLLGSASQFKLTNVYFGTDDQNIDLNFVSEHYGCDTHAEIIVQGALANNAVKTLRSTIDFKTGAKRAVGHESEEVLLFSPTVRNRTVPLILCAEEDVEGQHAASVGKMDRDKLFYLQSRGLSETEAKKLLLEAKFASAVEEIPSESVQGRIRAYLERSVDVNAERF